MDSKIVFALVVVVLLVVFIFMLNGNTLMKGLFSDVYGVVGQVNAELFTTAKQMGHHKKHDEFVPAYEEDKLDNTYEERNEGPASADNFEKYAPLSNYDGVDLNKDRDAIAEVMHSQTAAKNQVAKISDKPVVTLLGAGAPPAHEMRASLPDPYQTLPVDGKPGSPKSMFILANNAMSLDCCPSQYSGDLGCVCLTPEQKDMMGHRGGNRNAPSEY